MNHLQLLQNLVRQSNNTTPTTPNQDPAQTSSISQPNNSDTLNLLQRIAAGNQSTQNGVVGNMKIKTMTL